MTKHTRPLTAPVAARAPSSKPQSGPLQHAAGQSAATQRLAAFQLMADGSAAVQRLQNSAIQRMEEDELQGKFIQRFEEEEDLQMKPIQRMEEEELQGKFLQRAEAPAPKTNNTGLPDTLKSGIENLAGMSMDHVKVHRNSDKPAHVQAHAYAQGSEIHLAPGQEKHLPHEAWHVVQQAQGRVKPTMQMKGVSINDDANLETEADVMGAKAVQARAYSVDQRTSAAGTGQIMQQKGDRHYWYRLSGADWTYAGAFKSHATANAWLRAQNFPQGTGFGQGGKSSYK